MPATRTRARRPDGPPGRRRSMVVLVVLVAVVLAACGTSGRTLRDPAPGATAPPRKGASTTSAPALGTVPVGGLSITSPAWPPGGAIPVDHTCDGAQVSPPLTIVGAPAGTVELVLVVTDPDAGGFVHWVVAGIPPGTPSFPEGGLPPGALEAPNSGGGTGWVGPCPPAGTEHTYDLAVHALTIPSGLDATSTAEQVDAAVATASTSAAMTGTYARP